MNYEYRVVAQWPYHFDPEKLGKFKYLVHAQLFATSLAARENDRDYLHLDIETRDSYADSWRCIETIRFEEKRKS